jgi:predicted O-linked N-acetylglucosamine transferase (SPINDLY family)
MQSGPTPSPLEQSLALHRGGQIAEAQRLYREILATDPNNVDCLHLLGIAAAQQEQHADAVQLFRRALALRPDSADALGNLSVSLMALDQLDEAVAACRRAIEINPNDFEAHQHLGHALNQLGSLDEGQAHLRRAFEIEPTFVEAWGDYLYSLHYNPRFSPQAIKREHENWNQRCAMPLAEVARAALQMHRQNRSAELIRAHGAGRRLRIGYVSGDFRDHVVGRFLLPVLENHDHRQFEIFAYAHVLARDPVTARFQKQVDHWRDITAIDDAAAARQIMADRIDILVDLAGHTAGGRPMLFARKAAPVQVSYMGYANTTGLWTMDWRITDIHLDPPGMDDSIYTERSLRLPETYWVYRPPDPCPPLSPCPSMRGQPLTFCCLNNLLKVSEPAVRTWAILLARLPQSRLLLFAPGGLLPRRLARHFVEQGVLQRVTTLPRRNLLDYLSQYANADIALDPFPYTGFTTTMDALWMGVPVVSLAGRSAAWRGGVSILNNLGLGDLVAITLEQYIDVAAKLANDPHRLTTLRSTLRSRMQSSPLMDAPRLTRHIEAAYRTMYQHWLATP